jgi:hypothetical protein
MSLDKLKMTYAALMLAVLFLCIAEWGSCFSSPPKDPDGSISNNEDKENRNDSYDNGSKHFRTLENKV